MNEIQIFNHEEFGEIRTIEIEGQIYFVGVDVAKAIGYSNTRDALKNHVDKDKIFFLTCDLFFHLLNFDLWKKADLK